MKLLLAGTLAVVAGAAPSVLGAAVPTPALSISMRQPVSVRGAHFVPREWVRVTVLLNGSHSVRAHATGTGAFSVTFPDLSLGPCGGLQISATGARGSVATLKLPQRACMPAKNP